MPKLSKEHEELFQAVKENRVEPLRRLQAAGVALEDVRGEERRTLLHVAAFEGSYECLHVLLQTKLGKKVDSRDRGKRTALHLAAAIGSSPCVRCLVEKGSKLEPRDEGGLTPLGLAVKFSWPDTARALLDLGSNPFARDAHGATPFYMAQSSEDQEMASLFDEIDLSARRAKAQPRGLIRRCFFPSKSHQQEIGGKVGSGAYDSRRPPTAAPAQRPGSEELQKPALTDSAKGSEGLDISEIDVHRQDTRQHKQSPRKQPHESQLAAEQLALAQQKLASPARAADVGRGVGLSPSRDGGSSGSDADGPSAARGHAARQTGQDKPACFVVYAYFQDYVKKLEFEVEWSGKEPAVGNVRPDGEADYRGIQTGDRICEISGEKTHGRKRDDLLPMLKARPLRLKLHRERRQAYVELDLEVAAADGAELGLSLVRRGLLVVSSVKPRSAAWAAGVADGDAVVRINGSDATDARVDPAALLAALKEDAEASLTVWRRPVGVDMSAPWSRPQTNGADSEHDTY